MNRCESDVCPHCGHVSRIWKKGLISTAAASLCRLVEMYQGEPIHIDDFTVLAKDRNFSQLKLWGLIARSPNDDPRKRASGKWVPTERGIQFARGEIQVMKYVVTRDNEIIRFDPPMIGVKEALGRKFDYRVLMGLNRSGVPYRDPGAQKGLFTDLNYGQSAL